MCLNALASIPAKHHHDVKPSPFHEFQCVTVVLCILDTPKSFAAVRGASLSKSPQFSEQECLVHEHFSRLSVMTLLDEMMKVVFLCACNGSILNVQDHLSLQRRPSTKSTWLQLREHEPCAFVLMITSRYEEVELVLKCNVVLCFVSSSNSHHETDLARPCKRHTQHIPCTGLSTAALGTILVRKSNLRFW